MKSTKVFAECHFLDVGQGTSNVILLGEGRGIVIDCGRSSKIPLALLRRYVSYIDALIVSHNDRDHHGGASEIIAAYPKAIENTFLLQDRPVEQIALYDFIKQAAENGQLLSPPQRLERGASPRNIYIDEKKDLSLDIIFPTLLDNIDAQASDHPNETSAVLVLSCGKRRIVFPGDSTVNSWRSINKSIGNVLSADILCVPHHGGNITRRQQKNESQNAFLLKRQRELDWLYSKGVKCKYAIVSTGTANIYKHPATDTILTLRKNGAHVLCTQITKHCCKDLEKLRPGVRHPGKHSQSTVKRSVTQTGNSRNVACAGTIVTEIGPDAITICRLDEHQEGLKRLKQSPNGHPLCQ